MRAIAVSIMLLLLSGSSHAQEDVAFNSVLRDELLSMQQEDQIARTQPQDGQAPGAIAELDAKHTIRLREIILTHGWPTISLVGKDGAAAAFLIAQHADMDTTFQREVLSMMEPLVLKGEAEASYYAYLWDRTHTPQRFGTQGHCTGALQWEPREIQDPGNVDARRADVGLPTMKEYIGKISQFCRRDENS